MMCLMVLLMTTISLLGCSAAHNVIPNPSSITLENALDQVGSGLSKMHSHKLKEGSLGLYVAEVTVTFDVTAAGNDSNSLVIAPLTADALNTVSSRVSGSVATTQTSTRGNIVTVKFVNPLFAPQDTLIRNTTGERLYNLLQAMNAEEPTPDSTTQPISAGAGTRPSVANSMTSIVYRHPGSDPKTVQLRELLKKLHQLTGPEPDGKIASVPEEGPSITTRPSERILRDNATVKSGNNQRIQFSPTKVERSEK